MTLAASALVAVIVLGGNVIEAAELIFLPYFSEAHMQFGAGADRIVRFVPVTLQCAIVATIVWHANGTGTFARRLATSLGVLFVLGYFTFLVGVQFLSSIH